MNLNHRQTLFREQAVFISCIVPVYNESLIIESFVTELRASLGSLTTHFEIIVIDDGSQDGTAQRVFKFCETNDVKLICFSRNFGKEIALTAGLEHCSGDVAILIDADFQHPFGVFPDFLRSWSEGYDIVYGIRDSRAKESFLKRQATKLFYSIIQKITKIDIPHHSGDFLLMDRVVIHAMNSFQERVRFMKGLYAWVGFKKIGVPFVVQKRKAGKSSWNFSRLCGLALTAITSFSDVPLRVWSAVGVLISVMSLIYAGYLIGSTLFFGTDLRGFPTLATAIMFFGGIQLISIGILGEYIARIFSEVKKRPKYLVAQKVGFENTTLE